MTNAYINLFELIIAAIIAFSVVIWVKEPIKTYITALAATIVFAVGILWILQSIGMVEQKGEGL